MAVVTETIQVSGIRCEKCVMRLAKTLEGADGLESANANLMGQVLLSYDDERTTRDALVEQMARGGFREQRSSSRSDRRRGPVAVVRSVCESTRSPSINP